MLHAGLDLSRRKVDVCLLSDEGVHLDQLAVAPDVESLRSLAKRVDEVHREPEPRSTRTPSSSPALRTPWSSQNSSRRRRRRRRETPPPPARNGGG
jgi:hypothetical protein